ncbi:hypothetical protein SAMN05920897_12121 [Alkalispirochaeta americana]|uniref:Uncharacterized protein n=2 Tax=Alkalispirochaeta americana TaxID=159291 RepID=A0A1N6X8T2_9SPIO|nr:hypothetical protein SAMN05920897_12121 [Alkalispirochaeta americana]
MVMVVFILFFVSQAFSMGRGEELLQEEPLPVAQKPEQEPDPDPIDYMKLYEELSEDLPTIAFFPPRVGSGVDRDLAEKLHQELIHRFILHGEYRPVSIQDWLSDRFRNGSTGSIWSFLGIVRSTRLPVNYIGTTRFFRSGARLGVRVSVYPVERGRAPRHFVRIVDIPGQDEDELPLVCYCCGDPLELHRSPEEEISEEEGRTAKKGSPEKKNDFADENMIEDEEAERPVEEEPSLSERSLDALANLFAELTVRLAAEKEPANLFHSTIYVNPVQLKFFHLTTLECGDFEFSSIPFLSRDGADYRRHDDHIRDLLGYALHLGGLVRAEIGDMDGVVGENPSQRGVGDYSVDSELKLSERLMIFETTLINNRTGREVLRYVFPLESLDLVYLQERLRDVSRLLILAIVPFEARLQVGALRPQSGDHFPEEAHIYFQGYHLGRGDLSGQLLPAGLNIFRIAEPDLREEKGTGEYLMGVLMRPYEHTSETISREDLPYAQFLLRH